MTQRLSRKRPSIEDTLRKRALFSCDRCKQKKTKCHRLQDNDLKYDNITPCLQCTKAQVACMTTAPRKKRVVGMVDDVNSHYRALQSLVKGLFPGIDIQNMDKLNEIGQVLDINMPGNNGINIIKKELINEKLLKTQKEHDDDNLIQLPKLPANLNPLYESDRLMMDKFGHTHFIGNFGTASLLNGLCDLIIKKSFNINANSTRDIRDRSVQTITSEYKPIYQYPIHLYNNNINVKHFPMIDLLNREEANYYVQIYFDNVHPYYFIFNYDKFMETYESFWSDLNKIDNDSDYSSKLSSAQVCSIYLIWILGNRFQQHSNSPFHMGIETIAKFIDIVRLSLSDVVLTPSLDGIRLLALFSIYLSSIKVRESGFCLMELACIQTKSLGLHRKFIIDKFNPEMADVMKRVMWSLAKTESFLCCSFGRSSAIQWDEIDIDLPKLDDIKNDEQRIFYLHSIKLTKFIFEILDYKRWSQKEPLSLRSLERALLLKKKLETFFNDLPIEWQDYKLSDQRFKSRLHTHYNYFFITLTLPMFLYIVNSNTYIIKNDDPFLALVVCGIRSSFKTAEIIEYQAINGMFNGTIFYDVFNCYNAIMVLLLTYILFKISKDEIKPKIDLLNLNETYQINIDEILKSINKIRTSLINNLNGIDGTMKGIFDVIETLLNDLGLIQILKLKFPNVGDSFLDDLPKVIEPTVKEKNAPDADMSWLTDPLNTHISSDDNFKSMLASLNLDPDLLDNLFSNGRGI